MRAHAVAANAAGLKRARRTRSRRRRCRRRRLKQRPQRCAPQRMRKRGGPAVLTAGGYPGARWRRSVWGWMGPTRRLQHTEIERRASIMRVAQRCTVLQRATSRVATCNKPSCVSAPCAQHCDTTCRMRSGPAKMQRAPPVQPATAHRACTRAAPPRAARSAPPARRPRAAARHTPRLRLQPLRMEPAVCGVRSPESPAAA
jgi:hypothetical protein